MSSGVKRKASQAHCFAPGCSSGYVSARKSDRQVSLFSVSKDPERFKAWQRAVPRADEPLEATSVLCELHFDEQYLVRFFTHTINGFELPEGHADVDGIDCARNSDESRSTTLKAMPHLAKLTVVGCPNHNTELTNKVIKFYVLTRLHFLVKTQNASQGDKCKKMKMLKLRRVL
ncbi:hypothetical protein HPB51_012288 [Rhipicephalus microplus]|uniref:THAP-type domain-containing protein n=1 Tax=Rhipicephalus microplus TaxID=6941 RepID=A0A9J6E0B1_RHIMP|nr:hypothetical protein HPB51_012288 [Rhipicephalus microplus]